MIERLTERCVYVGQQIIRTNEIQHAKGREKSQESKEDAKRKRKRKEKQREDDQGYSNKSPQPREEK